MVPPRSCFRIVIAGPARGAQALFTVGPALILAASEVFFIPIRDPGGIAHGMVRALAGGGCGTTRGSGRWEQAAALQAGGEPRGAGVGLGPAGAGICRAPTRQSGKQRFSDQVRPAAPAVSRGGARGSPHAPAPPAAQLGTGAAAGTAPPSPPRPSQPGAGAGPGRAVAQGPRCRAMSPAGRAGPPHPAPTPGTAAGLRLRVRAAPGPPAGPR